MLEKVKKIVVDTLNCEMDQVTMDARLAEDLEADSLDAVDMVVVLEQKFHINIRQGYDLRSIVTLQNLYDFIEKIAQESAQKNQ